MNFSSYQRLVLHILLLLVLAWGPVLVAGTPQTITFPSIPVKKLTDATFTLAATASSGLPVVYEVTGGTSVVSVVGSVVTLSGAAGAFTICARQIGDSTYDPAPTEYRSSYVLGASVFSKIASSEGSTHVLGIKSDGTLWAWGSNSAGQIGDGTSTAGRPPQQVGTSSNWEKIATGVGASFGIRTDGTLWAWGANGSGQLGDGTNTVRYQPVRIGGGSDWTSVSGGDSHVIALKADGTLWAWGANNSGQVGDGTTSNRSSPTRIGSDSDWIAVAAGSAHSMAVRSNGTLWAWGSNSSGQLGIGVSDTLAHSSPSLVGGEANWVGLRALEGGNSHNLAVKSDGTLWAWGSNFAGQFGNGTVSNQFTPTQIGTDTSWTTVVAGIAQSVGTKQDGSLWSWGNSAREVKSDASGGFSVIPVQVGADENWKFASCGQVKVGLTTDGQVLTWDGGNSSGQHGTTFQPLLPCFVGLQEFKKVAAGAFHTLAIGLDGSLWVWGNAGNGQLGDGLTTSQRVLPFRVGATNDWSEVSASISHSLAVKSDGSLWAWGANGNGQLGDATTTARNTPVRIGSLNDWRLVSAGSSYSLAVKHDGTLWAWGSNTSGKLGDGTTTQRLVPIQIGTDSDWRLAEAGTTSSFAIKQNNTLWAWGRNTQSELGDGSTTDRLFPVQVGLATDWQKVSAGGTHTVAIKLDGTMWSWGSGGGGLAHWVWVA